MPVMILMMVIALGMTAAPDPSHRQDVEKWRAKHEADYRREFVALAGLFSLKPGVNTAGSAAGRATAGSISRSSPRGCLRESP